MKHLQSIFLGSFLSLQVNSQNFIPNSSFENYMFCPQGNGELYSAISWSNPVQGATPDYLNKCSSSYGVPDNPFGRQVPHTGDAYVGIVLTDDPGDYREYFETKLTQPLESGKCYEFELFWSLGETFSRYVMADLGVYFSSVAIINYSNTVGPLPCNPQINNPLSNRPDTTTWKRVTMTYLALGGEQFITIGNFTANFSDTIIIDGSIRSLSSYVFIDDVSLIQCPNTVFQDIHDRNKYNFGPDPFEEKVRIFSSDEMKIKLVMNNSAGQEVFNEFVSTSTEIDLTFILPGIYFYYIHATNGYVRYGRVFKK